MIFLQHGCSTALHSDDTHTSTAKMIIQGGAAGGPSVRRASARALTRHAHEVALRGSPNQTCSTTHPLRQENVSGREDEPYWPARKIHVTLKPHGRPKGSWQILQPLQRARSKQGPRQIRTNNHSFSRCHHLRCEHRPGVRRQREQTADAPLVANPSLPHADGQTPWQTQGCASGHAVHAQGPRRLLGCRLHQGAVGPRRFKTRSGADPTLHTRCL